MFQLLLKDKLPFFFRNQFIPNFIVFMLGFLLTYKLYSPLLVSASIIILYFYSYFIHVIFHYFPDIINIHINRHHNNIENNDPMLKTINLLIELFANIMFFVIFYYIQKMLSIQFVPEIILFYYGFIYVSVHIINYSIFHTANAHVLHHRSSEQGDKTKTCNFGPDLVDHVFYTNCTEKVENYNHIIPNTLISFLMTYYLYKPQLF